MKLVRILQDPRVVAGGAALLWILFDDLPTDPYATFADPGGAMMLSVFFGEFLALAVVRRWDKVSSGWLIGAAVFKLLGQSFFYIRDAAPVDTAFLFAVHLWVAVLAGKERNASAVAARCSLALAGCLGGYALSEYVFRWWGDSRHHDGYTWAFAAARVAFPFCFWTALSFVPRVAGRWREYFPPEPAAEFISRDRLQLLWLLGAVTIFAGLGVWSFRAKLNGHAELAAYGRFMALKQYLNVYAEEHAGEYPRTWDEFARASLSASEWRFHDRHTGEEVDWIYFGGHTKDEPSSQPHAPVILLAAPKPIFGKRAVIYTDTSGALLPEADFVRKLADQTNNPSPIWTH